MDLDELIRIANNFYYTHTYVAIGVIAALAIITFLKPKQTVKAVLILIGIIAAGYILFLISEALWSGFSDKSQMLDKY
ncbi:MAG: hypothetical protein KGY61_14180 [Desulfobacterales bacterium]|nr:hypothetical protein [Desulfobacterales bacterium]